jgi:oligoribonuclease NrnB/cAMP/cGMP phosphodiesterase (DHH superfamily)
VLSRNRAATTIELIGINYGESFPWDRIAPREPVLMVDFSLQPFSDMVRLRELTDALVWVDHHKTALADAHAAEWTLKHVPGIREVGIGACVLLWRYLFPNEPVPRAVQLLGEYDVWDHHDPDCLPFQYGARLLDLDPVHPLWLPLLSDAGNLVKRTVEDGRIVMRYQAQQNEGHAKCLCFDAELDGLRLIAANAGPTNSQFFDSVWDPKRYDAMCVFQYRPKSQKWTISLYTDKPDVDVSEVAKAHGGGGHKGAAGFQLSHVPFLP